MLPLDFSFYAWPGMASSKDSQGVICKMVKTQGKSGGRLCDFSGAKLKSAKNITSRKKAIGPPKIPVWTRPGLVHTGIFGSGPSLGPLVPGGNTSTSPGTYV